jgi:hypothetical protein
MSCFSRLRESRQQDRSMCRAIEAEQARRLRAAARRGAVV